MMIILFLLYAALTIVVLRLCILAGQVILGLIMGIWDSILEARGSEPMFSEFCGEEKKDEC